MSFTTQNANIASEHRTLPPTLVTQFLLRSIPDAGELYS
jgi:hypothetical protein